jgi:hypothetical protein
VRCATTLVLIAATAIPLAACGGSDASERPRALGPDPGYLVVQLSDLPRGFSPVPGESIRTPLAWVLADPWSAGLETVIRRERQAGYQRSFWTPEHRRVQCTAAVYRSRRGTRLVFRLSTRRFAAFAVASGGRPTAIRPLGDRARAFRFEAGRSRGFTVVWRYRNVISSCTSLEPDAAGVGQVVGLASAQQTRIANALG